MAESTCAKCGEKLFELKEQSLSGARFKMYLAQCSSCGTPVGVVSYYDPGVNSHEVNEKVDKLISEIQDISYMLQDIESRIK